MSNYDSAERISSDSIELSSCATCGVDIDPVRAARARLLSERFYYFCSLTCAENFEPSTRHSPSPAQPADLARTTTAEPFARAGTEQAVEPSQFVTDSTVPTAISHHDNKRSGPPPHNENTLAEHSTDTPSVGNDGATAQSKTSDALNALPLGGQTSANEPSVAPLAISSRLLWTAIVASALCLGLLLAKGNLLLLYARLGLTLIGAIAMGICAFRNRENTEQPWVEAYLLPLLSAVLAMMAVTLADGNENSAVAFAAMMILSSSASQLLLSHLEEPAANERRQIYLSLARPASRVTGDGFGEVSQSNLRPGEEIVIHAGEIVPADVTVLAGAAEVYPWLGATLIQSKTTGDFLYAGAKLASGQLRTTVRWTRSDRHWLRLLSDPARRIDRHAPLFLITTTFVRKGAAVALVLGIVIGLLHQQSPIVLALETLAAVALFLNPAIYRLAALRSVEAVLAGLRSGIVFRNAETLDAAGKISTAVFCARGTLLMGEPELSSIDVTRDISAERVLALVAGAEQTGTHPVAVALQRAARARGVRPDAVRSPQVELGLGVTSVASDGQPLVVGSRGLMLRERVSVARAEARITELEAMGRTVLLVAIGGNLAGVLALQDGLRSGARAAVQHLLDIGIEPVLLSGDGRETCEALGRTIDVDHIRPEVLPADRGAEVERLRSGGASVAVVGRSPTDDVALGSASISIALSGDGATNNDFDIELGSDEVDKSALALRLARHYRSQTVRALTLYAVGAALAVLALWAWSLEPALLPAATLTIIVMAILITPQKHTNPSRGNYESESFRRASNAHGERRNP